MKLSTLFTASLIALAEFGGIASADLFCGKRKRGWGWMWDIHSDDVGNTEHVCEEVHRLLKETGKWCVRKIPAGCVKNKYYPGKDNSMHLWFYTSEMCDDWRVAKAFCEATNGTVGWVECEARKRDWYFDPEKDIIRDGTVV